MSKLPGAKLSAMPLMNGPIVASCLMLGRVSLPGLLDYLGNDLLTMTVRGILPGKNLAVTVRYSVLAT